jgi:tetratricopeptide (TPR) repeat protein
MATGHTLQTGGDIKITYPPVAREDAYLHLHKGLAAARGLRRTGKLDDAQSICEKLVAEDPKFVGALQTLGWIHYTRRRYEQALSCFIHANMHNPDNHETLNFLASIYLKLGARVVAAQTLERALEIKPDDANLQHTLGNVYREESEYELAAQSFAKAFALKPESLSTAENLAKCCIQLGRFEEAAAALERAHEIKPESHKILFRMSLLPLAFVKIDLLSALERCRKQDGGEPGEFENTNLFTRAVAMDWNARYEEAWTLLVEANRGLNAENASTHRARRESREESSRLAEALVPERKFDEQSWNAAPLSLFILGPSRGGKTTVESLAGSIPGVKRGYENLIVGNAAARATQMAGFPTVRRAAAMPPAVEPSFAEAYRRELLQRAAGAPVFTNTNPGIIHDVGRLFCLIPGSRFVFVRRNTDDNSLRIFMTKYNVGNEYGYDLRSIHAQIAWYNRMADTWARKLPSTIVLTLNYEDVIADPKAARSQIAGLLGLPAPVGSIPDLGDDRGCATPYKAFMDAELRDN